MTRRAYPNPYILGPFTPRIIHAGPTCGKSNMAVELRQLGLEAFDTDDLIVKTYTWDVWRKLDWSEAHLAQIHIGDMVRIRLLLDARAVCLTNLWSAGFSFGLGSALRGTAGLLPIGVFRRTPERVVELSTRRGGTQIDLKTATQWRDDFRARSPGTFQAVRWLNRDQYLIDAVKLGKWWAGS